MSRAHPAYPIPRGHIDPIRSRADALAVLALAAPYGHDTVAILLDARRCGVGLLVVTDTTDDDAIYTIIEVCVDARDNVIAGLVLATSRPGGDMRADDRDRWTLASLQCDAAGVELVEWFVIGNHVACPRELTDDPPRWAGPPNDR